MRKGFTLIEVLVVVLIVGILAGAALPQYQRVVERSRFTKAQVMAKALQNSCERLVAEAGVDSYADLPSNIKNLERMDSVGENGGLLPTGFELNSGTKTIIGAGFNYKLQSDGPGWKSGGCYVKITKPSSAVELYYNGSDFVCSGDESLCDTYGIDYTGDVVYD